MKKNEDSEIKVFISLRDSICSECGENLGRKAWITLDREKGALCLSCADLDNLIFVGVHGFKGSEVQGSIFAPRLDLECVFTRKASFSSGIIQNLEQNWQLPGKMAILTKTLGIKCLFCPQP